uniref:Secreted protein n=1 Tax=Trichogramma kaykai TaxID=54128 RepID=A0ABD2W4Z9_9HYME
MYILYIKVLSALHICHLRQARGRPLGKSTHAENNVGHRKICPRVFTLRRDVYFFIRPKRNDRVESP